LILGKGGFQWGTGLLGKSSEETEAERHKKEYDSAHAMVFFVKITPDFGNTAGLGIVGAKNI
jgi:hypothetical protein